jgi:electron transfer flavoprotein beta subunit
MKILVPVKRVVDYAVKVRVLPDGSAVDTQHVKMSMNPFDEIALEEAVRLKEKGIADEVVALSIGPEEAQETLRAALALGADRAVHIIHAGELAPLQAARILRHVALKEMPKLILTGKQAIDDDANQTGQMLAALLGWGQATCAFRLTIEGEKATVIREVDAGLMTVELTLPALVTADLRLNTPRHVTLPGIMKARAKPIEKLEASQLGIPLSSKLSRVRLEEPLMKRANHAFKTVEELAEKLKSEAGL